MKAVIQLAIDSHHAWTDGFRGSIEKRVIEAEFSVCGYDDLCSFGKWLYSLDDDIKCHPAYRRLKDLHYRFHVEAGRILKLMQGANFTEAQKQLDGDYAKTSAQLIAALRDWQAAVPQ